MKRARNAQTNEQPQLNSLGFASHHFPSLILEGPRLIAGEVDPELKSFQRNRIFGIELSQSVF